MTTKRDEAIRQMSDGVKRPKNTSYPVWSQNSKRFLAVLSVLAFIALLYFLKDTELAQHWANAVSRSG